MPGTILAFVYTVTHELQSVERSGHAGTVITLRNEMLKKDRWRRNWTLPGKFGKSIIDEAAVALILTLGVST